MKHRLGIPCLFGCLMCRIGRHHWSAWRLEYCWLDNDDVLYRQCLRCRKSQKKDYTCQ